MTAAIYGYAGILAIAFVCIGLVFYCIYLYKAYFRRDEKALALLNLNLAANLGIPAAAISSLALVAILNLANPPESVGGNLVIEAFSLKFSGPSGPVLLWVTCFLSMIAALKMLRSK